MLVRLRSLAMSQIAFTNYPQSSLILGVIALFVPPFPVVVRRGCGADFLVNLLLTFFCWIPGVAHAFYVIVRYSDQDKRRHVRGHSSTSRDSTYGRSSNYHSNRRRSKPRSRSSSHERPAYPRYDRRERIELPQRDPYYDSSYYSQPPTIPPERPMYVYNR